MSLYGGEEEVFVSPETTFSAAGEEVFSPETNGPILPPLVEMQPEEGFALREWRRENAIRLEEKEKREKEIVEEIIQEADEFKAEFYRKWQLRRENNITSNREKEKLYVEGQEKFHTEASKNYFKAIAELIPNEVPTIEKKGKMKAQDKQPSIVVIQGPKSGKPTDLSRLRQIHLKLKHNPPAHLTPPPPPPPPPSSEPGKDAKPSPSTPAKPVSLAG